MSTSKQEKTKSTSEAILIGSLSGMTEVAINHPLWFFKTKLQSGQSITFNPKHVYRGITANASSMVPITAIQVGLTQFLQNILFKDVKELSPAQKIMTAFVAGMASSLVSCPTEMVMTTQGKQKEKISFHAAHKKLVASAGYRCLYNGLLATAIREGMFTAFFLASIPLLKKNMEAYGIPDYAASVSAGICSGMGASLTSQWVDTIKTIQQASDVLHAPNFRKVMYTIYSTKGMQGFFAGTVPRTTRVMSALTVMGIVSEKMEQAMNK